MSPGVFSKKKLRRDISSSSKACGCWGQVGVGAAEEANRVVDDAEDDCVVCVQRVGMTYGCARDGEIRATV